MKLEQDLHVGPIEALELTIEMLDSVSNPPEDVTTFMSDYEMTLEMQQV